MLAGYRKFEIAGPTSQSQLSLPSLEPHPEDHSWMWIFSLKYYHNTQFHNLFQIPGNVINFSFFFVTLVLDCLNGIKKKKNSQAIHKGFPKELQTIEYLKIKSRMCDRFSSLLSVHFSPEGKTPNLAQYFQSDLNMFLFFVLGS